MFMLVAMILVLVLGILILEIFVDDDKKSEGDGNHLKHL